MKQIGRPVNRYRRYTRDQYSQLTSRYKKELAELYEKHGTNINNVTDQTARARIKRLRDHLNVFRTAMKRLDARVERLTRIDKRISNFLDLKGRMNSGYTIRSSSRIRSLELDLAKRLFCHYTYVMGIQGSHVSSYIGYKSRYQVNIIRSRFRKELQTSLYYRNKWNEFNQFIKYKQAA